MRHHGEALRALTKDDALQAALERDPARAPLALRGRALVDYAIKLTRTPHAVTKADITALRKGDLSDMAIHDAAAIIGYFNFVNRMASGLNVELEVEYRHPADES